ncbi:transcription elongation factor GreA [Candidatus Uhrbacteria bacterium]|nr:transcription elongation factor GreA [Candidatus Uhrbacteria bacterium]
MPHYLTKEGLERLAQDLHRMKTVARREVIERIAEAKELGDLRENAEYAEAKDDQAMLESKILEYENILKNAVIIDNIQDQTGLVSVQIGATVTVEYDSQTASYQIVGSEEADPIARRISNESPLGRAFLGRRVGEKVMVKVPRGEFEYVIVDIK